MKTLKLKSHNAKKEIEFELKYLRSISVRERFEMMFAKTKEMLSLLGRHENRKSSKIIKRA